MFRRLLDRFNRFMYGRYGADSLYYTLLIVFLLLGFINTFLRSYMGALSIFFEKYLSAARGKPAFSRYHSKNQAFF